MLNLSTQSQRTTPFKARRTRLSERATQLLLLSFQDSVLTFDHDDSMKNWSEFG
jgi:hypothetical protein